MISVLCIRGTGDRQAPDIIDELISTERIARLRGSAFLDETYYNRSRRTVRAPFADIRDGQIVDVRDGRIGGGKFRVTSSTIEVIREQGGGRKVTVTLDLEGRYADPQ